jgi:hypothetical protein
VRTAVPSFVRKFGGEMPLQLSQLADHVWLGLSLGSVLDYMISSCWCAILGERCATLCLTI